MFKKCVPLIALLTVLPGTAFAAPASPMITLESHLEPPTCPVGQPLTLALVLHNDSTEQLEFGSAFEQSSFHITVTDSTGHPVPRTAEGQCVLNPPGDVFWNPVVELDPGQALSYRYNLTRLFDLSRTGDYTVNVSRRLSQENFSPYLNNPRNPSSLRNLLIFSLPPERRSSRQSPALLENMRIPVPPEAPPADIVLTVPALTVHVVPDTAAPIVPSIQKENSAP